MSGYAASARIVRAVPHVVRHEPPGPVAEWDPPAEAGPVVVDGGWVIRPTSPITLTERWGRFRDRWTQLTFYTTDPSSWR